MSNADIVKEFVMNKKEIEAYKKKLELYELSFKMDKDKIDNLLIKIDKYKEYIKKLISIINNIDDKNKTFSIMEEFNI